MSQVSEAPGAQGQDPLGSPLARAAFEAATEGLLVLDPQGIVLALNGAFCRLYGVEAAQTVNRHYSTFTEQIEVERLGEHIGPDDWVTVRALRGESAAGLIQSIRNLQTGRTFVARCGAVPFFQDERLVAATITVEDVTEELADRQALREQAARYEAVLAAEREVNDVDGDDYHALLNAAIEQAAILTGADGACVEIQEGDEMVYEAGVGLAARFVGLRLAAGNSLSGRTVRDGVPTLCTDCETDDRVDREACRRIGTRSMGLVPLRYDRRSFGVLKVLAVEANAFDEDDLRTLGLLAGFLGAAIGRGRATLALRRSEAELERRVQERTEELSRANRDLDEFAYSVAHDLRSPLRAIVATSRMLIEDIGDRLTADERSALLRQDRAGLRLARIVDDLLGFARLAKAEPRRVAFDLTDLARKVAEEVTARRPTCRITVADDLRAEGDPNLVGYVLTNLLDNACKFSPEGGEVTVARTPDAFFVQDQGVGFDMSHAGRLFTAFERLVGQSEFEGTGVGLANVKRIVEKHGGNVWAESAPGQGATFFFTLG